MFSKVDDIPCNVNAIFTDYDGTIAPVSVSREESHVFPEIEPLLIEISRYIPIAVITTKTYAFIKERTEKFAHAWACSNGVEIITKDGRRFVPCEVYGKESRIKELLSIIRELFTKDEVFIEEKWVGVTLVGFCIDWRLSGKIDLNKLNKVKELAKERNLYIIEYEGHPFIDIFSIELNKAFAVKILKAMLNIDEPILYLGDSENDNPAFKEVSISVAVIHEFNKNAKLEAKYKIPIQELPKLLTRVLNCVRK